MPGSDWVSILANLLSAQADIEALETAVEDRLSDLREIGQSGTEATLLAELELYIHEFREQLRPEYQVYMVAQSVWDRLQTTIAGSSSHTDSHDLVPPQGYIIEKKAEFPTQLVPA